MNAEYFCACCRTPFLNSYPLDLAGRCGLCRTGVNAFDAAYSFGAYEGVLRELLHLYKYSRVRPLANALGTYLVVALPRDERFDMIVPTPLHWRRRWQRGFNQSELLAEILARRSGVPLARVLGRARATEAQTGLTHSRRRDNVRGAFRVKRNRDLRGRRVLLVDDVLTTGATAAACAAALKRAGAGYVAVLTVARADRRLLAAPLAQPAEVAGVLLGAR